MNILVVEDDKKISDFVSKGLSEAGHTVEKIYEGLGALDALLSGPRYDLVILDLMLPGLDGISILEKIRAEGNKTPVLILSAKQSVDERVQGLEKGGDDYLVKPFAFSELLARVQVLLRRTSPQKNVQQTTLEFMGIRMDLLKREVLREKKKVDLQAKEFSLLEYFLRNPERVLSKTMILENVYGYSFDPQTNVVDVLVCRLRNKLDDGFDKKSIQTIRGVGYVLRPE